MRYPVIAAALGLSTFLGAALPAAQAQDFLSRYQDRWNNTSKEQKFRIVNASAIGLITLWGFAKWDYGSRSPHAQSEDWFGNDTKYGGADKLGHFWIDYTATRGLSALYETWGYPKDDAALYGALSAFAITGYMELGDSFSDFGFSWEDMTMNALGSVAGYYLYKYPQLAEKIDFRVEYSFNPTQSDFSTDYENLKHLLALKGSGFAGLNQGLTKYLELHLGYYTRGFDDDDGDKHRYLYVGLGLNVSELFARRGYRKTATFFNFVQPPFTYLEARRDLND